MACPNEIRKQVETEISDDIKERYGIKSLSGLDKKLASKIVNEINNSIYNERLLKLSFESDMGERGMATIEFNISDKFLTKVIEEAEAKERVKALELYYADLNKKNKDSVLSDQALEEQNDDVDVDVKEFNKMPFKPSSIEAIKKGTKTISIRPKNHKTATYSLDGELYNVYNEGLMSISEYLEKTNLTKAKLKEKFIQDDDIKFKYIQDWFDGKGDMYIYEITPVRNNEDVIADNVDSRFTFELQKLENIKRNLDNLLKSPLLSDSEREFYKKERQEINDKIKELKKDDKKTVSTIISQAYDNIKRAEDILKQNVSRKTLDLATNYILSYPTLLHQFEVEGKQKLEVEQLTTEVVKSLNKINSVSDMFIKNKILAESKRPWEQYVKDINSAALYTLSASDNPNTIVQLITKKIKSAESKINISFRKFEKELKDLATELQDFTKAKGEKATEFMLQKDKEGENTGDIVREHTIEYNADYREAKDGGIVKLAKFLVNNHSFEIDKDLWNKKQEAITKEIENDTTILADEKQTVEEKKKKKIDIKIKSNDPNYFIKYLEKLSNNNANDDEVEYIVNYIKYNGWNYKGQPLIKRTVTTKKYLDKTYQKIQNLDDNDIRKKFYNYYVDKMKEGISYVSMNDDISAPYSYIPSFEKTLPFWSNIPDKVKNAVSQKIVDSAVQVTDYLTGEPVKNIPVHSITNKLDPSDKSYDLTKVLEGFFYEALNKKYKEEIEDDVNLYLAAVKNQKVYVLDKAGNIQYEDVGGKIIPKTSKMNESKSYLQAKYLIDAQIYGQKQNIELNTGKKIYNSKENKKINEFKNLQKERGITKEQIDTNLYEGLTEEETKEYKTIIEEGGQNLTGNKIANFLIDLTVKKALGFNFFGGITEYIQGIISITTEAAGGQFFNDANAKRAFRLMIHSNNPDINNDKIDTLLDLFNLRESFNVNYDTTSNKIDKALFWHLRKAEKQVKGMIMLSILDNMKITTDKGKVALLDIIDVKDGEITVKDGYDDVFNTVDKNGNKIPSELRLSLENKIQTVIKKISSRDNSKDPIKTNQYSLGRLVGQFRQSWMFEAIHNRFGAEKDILSLDAKTKGFYRSVFYNNDKLSLIKGFRILSKVLMNKYSSNKEDLGLSEIDLINAKKMLKELSWMMSSYSVYLAMSLALAEGDDDEEEYNPVLKSTLTYLLNQSYRTNRDLTFYISPESGQEITKNIIPAVKTIADFFEIAKAIRDIPFGDIYINEGRENEEIKLVNKTMKAFPITNVPKRMYKYLTDKTYTQGK